MRPEVYEENPALANWDRLSINRAVFDGDVNAEVQYRRVAVGKVGISGGPYLKITGDGPGSTFTYTTATGKQRPYRNSTLFTWTSKMSCASFSLPAGPVKQGGTCPASTVAAIEKEGTYTEHHPPISTQPAGQVFICDVCYAGKGRYLMYKSMSIGQVVKLAWVNETLRDGTFVRKMSEAIGSLLDDEIEEYLARKLVSNKFFRIHDSGDFFSPEYYKAWVAVCRNLPKVSFWAPTRMWVYEKWRALFSNYPPPDNLALRPSALFTSAPPPSIEGLAEGSTSIEGRMPAPVWNCPAYEGEEEHSCAAARCRVCWKSQSKPVNYMTH